MRWLQCRVVAARKAVAGFTAAPDLSRGEIPTAIVDNAARDRAAEWLGRAAAKLPAFAERAALRCVPLIRIAPTPPTCFACIGTTIARAAVLSRRPTILSFRPN